MNQVTTSTLNLLIIDSQVSNWESLAAGVASDTAVLILDPATDGLTQISYYLNSLSGEQALNSLQSIQIISHGSAGSLTLGSSTVTTDNLNLYTSQLSTIGNALSVTGDILLYGCDVAANQIGLDFINQFAALTSADVAASTDITGSALLGGNWQLEVATGSIESALALPSSTIDNFAGVLGQGGNNKPTLTVITSPFTTVNEDTEIEITFAQLKAGTNAADSDGTVAGFSITSLTSGTLRIGADAQSANPWVLGTNALINITHKAYWTPGLNVNSDNNNGNLNAFIVKAVDDQDANSVGEVQAIIAVTAVNDLPFLNSNPGTLLAGIEDNAYIVSKAALLEGWVDVEGSALNIENLSADNGVVNDNGDGTYTIAPSANFNGPVNLTYEVTDGTGAVSAAQSYTLTAVNDAPVFGVAAIATSIGNGFASASSVLVQNNGMIVMGGYSNNGLNDDFTLLRYKVDGTLDTDFGAGTGIVASDFFGMGLEEKAYAMAIQPLDGKILLAGTASLGADIGVDTDIVLARYNYDGTLDQSFGYEGVLAVGLLDINGYSKIDECRSISLQSDGKILLAGFSGADFALIRVNTDGSLDTSFGELVDVADPTLLHTGVLTTDLGGVSAEGFSVTVQADGRILMAGSVNNGFTNDFALVRYNADGSLDNSFDVDGIVTTGLFGVDSQGYSMTLQGDQILLGGYTEDSATGQLEFALVRYNADGSLDTSFGLDGTGIIITDLGYDAKGYSVAIQADGQILLSGFSGSDFAQVRYNGTTGILDAGFGVGGIVTTHLGAYAEGHSVTLQDDGKILLAGISNNGSTTDFTLVRYNSDGSLDESFDAANATQVSFVEKNLPVVLNSTVGIYDAELNAQGSYEGASLTLARELGANSEDVFSGNGNLSFSGTDVILSNVVVGSVINSNGTLSITFNTNATQIVVDEVVSLIAYLNTNDQPPASVTIDWTFNDNNSGLQGEGGSLSVVTSTVVNITPVNDAPVLSGVAATLINGIADTSYVVTVSDLLTGYTDPDGDALTINNLFADHGDVFDNGDGSFDIIPAPTYIGAMVLTYEVSDGIILTPVSLSYDVIPCNDGAPLLTGLPVTLPDVAEDTPVIVTVAELLQGFTDIDSDQMRVVGLTCDQGEVVLNEDGISYTIIPNLNYFGSLSLSYSVQDYIPGVDGYSLTSEITTLTYTISPVNDAAVLSADVVYLIETNAPLSTSGQLTISDIDSAETFEVQTDFLGAYGVFNLDVNGAWTYVATSAHDEFIADQLYTDTFTVVSADGTESTVTVNIVGTNDAVVLSADVADLVETNAPLSTSGQLTISDVDSVQTFVAQIDVIGTYGVFFLGEDGAWTYDATSAYDEFIDGQLYTDTFSVFSTDGTESSVTVNILGTNDAAEFSTEVADLVETDVALSTSGQMLIIDVDSANAFIEQPAVMGQYGIFSIGIDGIWTYDATSAHDEFVNGITYTDTFSVFSVDGTESSVTINILGTNDAPLLAVLEAINYADTVFKDTFATVTGQLFASDAEGDVLTYGIEGGTDNLNGTISQTNEYGELTIDTVTGVYAFVANAAAIEPLTADASASFTLTSSDGLLISSAALVINITQNINTFGGFSINSFTVENSTTECNGDDALTGTAGSDVFDSLAGNDNISGLEGDDLITGGLGNDKIDGGLGNDTANFGGDKAGYNFTYTAGTIVVKDTNLVNGNDGVDTLTNVETLHFADKDLTVNFDREFYLGKYADLRNAFGTNLDLASKHYITYGFKENRTVDNGGNDTLNGSESTNHLNGGAGNDSINGKAGDDFITGGLGSDKIDGGLGNDTANFGGDKAGYNFTYTAGTIVVKDTNLVNGNEGVDTLANIETLHFADKDLTVNFDREFYLGKYADLRNAFATNLELATKHYITYGFKEGRTVDNGGNDTLNGSGSTDHLNGGVGNDTINGKGGHDLITGGLGSDKIDGGLGSDTANYGGAKADYGFAYNAGTITVTDKNLVNGNEGVDTLTNVETLHFADKDLTVNFDQEFYLAKYSDLRNAFGANLEAATKHYITYGFKEGRTVDNGGNDTLKGSESADNLNGGAGNDIINGKGGDDIIDGGIGDDTIDGGLGHDVLTGGNGLDVFKLINLSNDTITDFVVADDTIQLGGGVFTSLNYVGQLQADNFTIGVEATDSNDFIIYDNITGALSYDTDGNGLGVAIQIALLGVDLGLTNTNFSVIG